MKEKRRPVIVDCDPGIDDAVALLLAAAAPELELVAVTAVAGNVGLDKTSRNARRVLTLAGVEVPVYAGAAGPMFGEQVTADEVHGVDGLLGIPTPEPTFPLSEGAAWDVIWEKAAAYGGALEIVATGPLTNLGIALTKYPALPEHIKRIVLMGGATDFGNTTPAAEYNIYADPEAAELVFRSGIPIAMCGLDVTHRAYFTQEEIDRLAAIGTPQAVFAARTMGFGVEWHQRFLVPGAPMHDPCAMMYALEPELFTGVRCWVGVECQGRYSRGKTVTDAYSDAKFPGGPNVELVTGVDRARFVEHLTARLAALGAP
ncbi:nucleoside hydrolase [Intestinimonas sp.]|uniref:nucleoside hydrolase n=1 Tax=Intestinimonas sp. TaxID=1965293 RepID=UPI00261661C5|nr:nucleoside hydrolase [Intestinimonas sp.]